MICTPHSIVRAIKSRSGSWHVARIGGEERHVHGFGGEN
jgi:hypothetical protein